MCNVVISLSSVATLDSGVEVALINMHFLWHLMVLALTH